MSLFQVSILKKKSILPLRNTIFNIIGVQNSFFRDFDKHQNITSEGVCDVEKLCELIRKYAPDCKIKINTVVTTRNRDEQLSDFIDTIKPDRWKILKMKTFVYGTFSNMSLQVSAAEFDEFVRQNKIVNEKTRIVVEPDMKASYILIGPNGWLLDNAANEMTPVEICDCKKEKLKEGLKKLTLDEKRYCNRYAL